MTRITSIHPISAANLFAVFYGLFGFVYMLQNAFRPNIAVHIPLGLALPYLGLKINITTVFPVSLIAPLCYAVSGWISGVVAACLYNAVALYSGGLRVNISQPDSGISRPAQSNTSPVVLSR